VVERGEYDIVNKLVDADVDSGIGKSRHDLAEGECTSFQEVGRTGRYRLCRCDSRVGHQRGFPGEALNEHTVWCDMVQIKWSRTFTRILFNFTYHFGNEMRLWKIDLDQSQNATKAEEASRSS